jgi:hypothetical protein
MLNIPIAFYFYYDILYLGLRKFQICDYSQTYLLFLKELLNPKTFLKKVSIYYFVAIIRHVAYPDEEWDEIAPYKRFKRKNNYVNLVVYLPSF